MGPIRAAIVGLTLSILVGSAVPREDRGHEIICEMVFEKLNDKARSARAVAVGDFLEQIFRHLPGSVPDLRAGRAANWRSS
jgi:hypothetical protein